MALPIGTLLRYLQRKYRSRLDADAPSWTASAIIRSMSATASADDEGGDRWRCARVPALLRIFGRTRRHAMMRERL